MLSLPFQLVFLAWGHCIDVLLNWADLVSRVRVSCVSRSNKIIGR